MEGAQYGRDMSYRSPAPISDGGEIGRDMTYYSPGPVPMPAYGGEVGSDLYGSARSRGSTRGR